MTSRKMSRKSSVTPPLPAGCVTCGFKLATDKSWYRECANCLELQCLVCMPKKEKFCPKCKVEVQREAAQYA